MKSQGSFEVDIAVLSSMEFESICECVTINLYTKEILATCSEPASWVVLFHGIRPSCGTASKLMCSQCIKTLIGEECIDCGAERFISATPIGDNK